MQINNSRRERPCGKADPGAVTAHGADPLDSTHDEVEPGTGPRVIPVGGSTDRPGSVRLRRSRELSPVRGGALSPSPHLSSPSKCEQRPRGVTATHQRQGRASMNGDRLPSVCPECGEVFDRDDTAATCPTCQPARGNRPNHYGRGSSTARGYDERWRRLSLRARRLSPQCADCGSVDELTADHSAEAWRRREAGLSIRLRDIDVVCLRCNAERGAARGARAGEHEAWRTRELAALVDELDREDDEL